MSFSEPPAPGDWNSAGGLRFSRGLSGRCETPRFDCLVLDIQLGGISGIELHQRLNALGSTIPVIYLTAHDELETREAALAAGCAAYFRKTDSGEAVLEAIRQAAGPEQGQHPGATNKQQTEPTKKDSNKQ